MAGEQDIGELPRKLQARADEALNRFIEDAHGSDPNTADGVHDRLRRTHGLESQESRRRVTSMVEHEARQVADLDERIRTYKDLSDRVEKMTARLEDAKTKVMADQRMLAYRELTKPDLLRKGLDSITKFITNNPAIVPELLEKLKPMETELRSEISKASKNASEILSQLAAMQQRCREYDQMLKAEQEKNRLAGRLFSQEKELRELHDQYDIVLHDVRGILRSRSREQSTDDESQYLAKPVSDAYSGVLTHMRNCSSLEQRKIQLEGHLEIAREEVRQKDTLVQPHIRPTAESKGAGKELSNQQVNIADRRELLAKLPSLDEYNLLRREIRDMEDKARTASHADETLKFCSSVLATVAANGDDPHTSKVDVERLQAGWNVALVWPQRNRSSLSSREFRAVVHGLFEKVLDSNDALTLARLLLIRGHTSPSLLSVALVDQLATALSDAGESIVSRSMGFIFALLQEKSHDLGDTHPWSFSKGLLVARCLSILATYVHGTEVCSNLARFAEGVRDKVSSSSLLGRVILEHAIKSLTGPPESLAETLAQLTFVRGVKTKTGQKLYPDGENLVIVDVDNKVAFVRPHQFRWPDESSYQPYLSFQTAPLMGTRRVELPTLAEEEDLYDIFHKSMARAVRPESVGAYHPDYIYIVQ